MPLHTTILKIHCPIILLYNLELCGKTIQWHENDRHKAQREGNWGDDSNRLTCKGMGRHIMNLLGYLCFFFIFRRHQFPFHDVFSIIINKSQGQSLRIFGLHLLTPIFAYGQLYIALSRCINYRNLSILFSSDSNGNTQNVVYKEIPIWGMEIYSSINVKYIN